MKTVNHITASCSIRNHTVEKNGDVLFSAEHTEETADFLVAAYKNAGIEYPRFYKMDTLCKLGWLSSEILLKNVFSSNEYVPEETGLIFFNANASLDTDLKYQATLKEMASPAVFVYTLPNVVIGEISIRNRFKGHSTFFIAEKLDAVFMHRYVSDLLDNGILKSCICGWVDVLEKQYESFLFLIERKESGLPFTVENINTLFQPEKNQR